MAEIIIENIVTTTQLADEIDIQHLANKIENSKYDPNEFPGLILHYSEPILFPFCFQVVSWFVQVLKILRILRML